MKIAHPDRSRRPSHRSPARLAVAAAMFVAGSMHGGPAWAATVGEPGLASSQQAAIPRPALSPEQQEVVARVELYLNGVETLRARFLQVSGNGAYAEGKVFLSRPGRMRLEYDPPSPILIVANGKHLIYHDAKLEQTSYIGLDSTPAGIMLRPDVRLDGDVTVTGVQRSPGAVEVSVVQTKDPAAGELTLLFGERPFALKQWRVKDAQGQVVTVSLYDPEPGVTLDPDLFKFTDPNFFKPKDD